MKSMSRRDSLRLAAATGAVAVGTSGGLGINSAPAMANPPMHAATSMSTVVNSRTEMKTLNGTDDPIVYLSEGGRSGWFSWNATVPVSTHQQDTLEGIYVAPSATANGAYVRNYAGEVWAEWWGAVGHKTDAAALASGAASSTAAIQAAVLMLRKSPRALSTDGLTAKQITVYESGTIRFGDGIFVIEPDVLRFTQDIGLILRGNGSRGKTNYLRAQTTILVKGASAGYGIQWYSNGARSGGVRDMDICYESASFTGDVLQFFGAPGGFPERCMIGTFGIGTAEAPRRQTARSCVAIAWDEFFHPKQCVFDGALRGIFSDDLRTLASFTGSISGTTLTVTSVSSGSIGAGEVINGSGVTPWTRITSQLTSTEPGGVLQGRGTYQVSSSHALGSQAFTADIPFGGSNSHIQNCVFYDLTLRHIQHAGNRLRYNFYLTQSTANPIALDTEIAVDLRLVRGLGITDVHFVGSVGNIATNGWLYIDASVGYIQGCNFMDPGGTVCAVGTLNGEIDFSSNACQASHGLNLTGGVITGRANWWLLTSACWSTSPLRNLHVDLGPDTFEGSVGKSYDINTGAGEVTGSIHYSANLDQSSSKFENSAPGVTVDGHGTKSVSGSGTTSVVATDTGKTIYAAGGSAQTFALPAATPGLRFEITKVGSAALTVTAPSGTPFYTGDAGVRTTASNAGSTTGATIAVESIGTSGWSVRSTVGGWTYS